MDFVFGVFFLNFELTKIKKYFDAKKKKKTLY